MAVKINENSNNVVDSNSVIAPVDEISTSTSAKKPTIDTDSQIKGLSAIEVKDPNSISVTVKDKDAPLIVLFGPRACGKTMTLVRLTRFLRAGYTIKPIPDFRPTYDANYADICANFDTMINSDDAAKSTDRISFMLVEVIKNGRRICQILEAPGEHYFDDKAPKKPFPSYVNTIINNNNRKIWTIMVEPNWRNEIDRNNYVSRINDLKPNFRAKDDVVFLFNKIDKTSFVINFSNIYESDAIKEVSDLYPNIFTPFLNQNPITKLFKKYNCDFVPFQTGNYTKTDDGGLNFQQGPQEYCEHLWKVLLKKIYG